MVANAAFLPLIIFGISSHARSGEMPVSPQPIGAERHVNSHELPFFRQRIDAEIATLKTETLEQSIRNVITNDQQYYGYSTGGKANPELNLERMLAARRAVKVIQGIEALEPGEREAACKRMFAQAFATHTNTFRVVLNMWEDPSAPPNKQSMLATQEGLCAAMFAAADLGLREVLSDEFAQLDWFQAEVLDKRTARNPSAYDGPMRELKAHVARFYSVPDNRFQLNVLRLAASRGAEDGDNLLSLVDGELETNRVHLSSSEISVTAWDAQTTWFEGIHPRSGGPMDTQKGVTRYVVFDWVLDADSGNPDLQQQLIQKLRQLILGKS